MAKHCRPCGREGPAKLLHQELRSARDRGEKFEFAWPRARLKVLQVDPTWSRALAWSMNEWKSCYERSASDRGRRLAEIGGEAA
jgi:hypothetical protein